MRHKRYNILDMILPIIYKICFERLYLDVLSPAFYYLGSYVDVNSEKMAQGWGILFIILFCMMALQEDMLKSFFRIMLYFSIIPSCSLYGLKNENYDCVLLIILYWLSMWAAIFFIQRSPWGRLKLEGFFLPDCDKAYMWLLFGWSILSSLYLWGLHGGGRFFIDFYDVYKYRNTGISLSSVESYIMFWNSLLFLPLCMYIFFMGKRYIRFLICFAMMIFLYVILGQKIIVFIAALVIGIIVLSKLGRENKADFLAGVFLLVCQVKRLFIYEAGIGQIGALLYRFLVVPSEAHFYYYDFFQKHDLLYLRQSILRHFFSDPYNMPVSKIIGESGLYYLRALGEVNNMNNGLFSDAYQNFGAICCIVFPISIILI